MAEYRKGALESFACSMAGLEDDPEGHDPNAHLQLACLSALTFNQLALFEAMVSPLPELLKWVTR